MYNSINIASVLILLIAFIIGLVFLVRFIYRRLHHKEESKQLVSKLSKDFERMALKTRLKRWTLTAGIALTVLSGAWFTVWRVNSHYMEKAFIQASNDAQNYFMTQAPNVDANNLYVPNGGVFSATLHADTYKNIDGYRIPWSPYDFDYGTMYPTAFSYPMSPVLGNGAFYTQDTNQKIATFFSPDINYKDKNFHGVYPTHDAQTLKDLPKTLAEVAVSFDKPYTYAEIQKMIPSNLLINWYWIGLNDKTNVNFAGGGPYFGVESDMNDNGVLKGTLSSEGYQQFVAAMKASSRGNLGSLTVNNFNFNTDALKQVQKYPTLATAKFSGVILTGRTENLAGLDGQKWVYATNVGLTTPLLPYLKPIK